MLRVALILNIAIILFGWRRSKDLKDALTAFEEAERLAMRNANTDPTTGLDNRRQLVHSLAEALEIGRSGVLLLMDLDHFKRVNDLHGHQAGDELLRHTAMVLGKAAPKASCHARIGGDEFALVLPETTAAKAEDIARTVLARISTPVFVSGAQRQVSASIGLAAFDRGSDQETVIRQSDVALYAAKGAGRNAFAWFDEALGAELAERLAVEEDMRRGNPGRRVRTVLPAADRPQHSRPGRVRDPCALALTHARLPGSAQLHRCCRAHRPGRAADHDHH